MHITASARENDHHYAAPYKSATHTYPPQISFLCTLYSLNGNNNDNNTDRTLDRWWWGCGRHDRQATWSSPKERQLLYYVVRYQCTYSSMRCIRGWWMS